MSLMRATVEIKGTRPLLFNVFNLDAIPLIKREKKGVAGNNPEEWKKSFKATPDGKLYLPSEYIYSCIRAGAKHTSNGRGTMEPTVSATLQVIEEEIILNRQIKNIDNITNDTSQEVYIDVRPVTRRGAKNIRYRLATSSGWEARFSIQWENTLISPEVMHQICIDAGSFSGVGDGRKIGFGRFEIINFKIIEDTDYAEKTNPI